MNYDSCERLVQPHIRRLLKDHVPIQVFLEFFFKNKFHSMSSKFKNLSL